MVCTSGWVSDDATITLRSVDNFLNGHGLRWNIAERVQVYTHPLWFWMLAASAAITNEYFLSTIAVSIFCSITAIALFYRRIPHDNETKWWSLIALCASMSFVDYSTSGLENPLSHLLIAGFFIELVSTDGKAEFRTFASSIRLCLYVGLLLCTRMDLVLICAVALVAALIQVPRRHVLPAVAIGFFPFVLWEIFSVIYYGSFFPNTAYAKLAARLDRTSELYQGTIYFFDSLIRDPVTLITIVTASCLSLTRGPKVIRGIGAGLAGYLVYIIWIGGDFMSGRFFSTPFYLAVCVLAHQRRLFDLIRSRVAMVIVLSLGVRFAITLALPTIDENDNCAISSYSGVADEAGCYASRTGIARLAWGLDFPSPLVRAEGEKFLKSGFQVISAGNVGMLGLIAGPTAKIIDVFGLTDPLLARLPASPGWLRVGHLCRGLPEGYLKSVLTDSNVIEHPELAKFYDVVRSLTRAPVFDRERLNTVLAYQLGEYDALLEKYPRKTVHRAYWCQGYGLKSVDGGAVEYPVKEGVTE